MTTLKFYTNLCTQVILIFGIAILASFIPDNFHTFFGDVLCNGNLNASACSSGWNQMQTLHGPEYHWGYRHWLWLLMGLSLFLIQLVRIIKFIDKENG